MACVYFDRGQFLHRRLWPLVRLDGLPSPLGARRCSSREWCCSNALDSRSYVCRNLIHDGVGKLHDHDHPDASSRDDDDASANDHMVHVHYGHIAGLRLARFNRWTIHATFGPRFRNRFFPARGLGCKQRHSGGRRRAAPFVAAPLLVLLAPCRLHHDSPCDGNGFRHPGMFQP